MSDIVRSGISGIIDTNSVYNLKRRIALLPPISATVFQNKVIASDSGDYDKEDSHLFRRSCTACEQHYTNRNAWQAHLESRNHDQKTTETDSKASSLSDESPLSTLSLNTHEEDQSASKEESFSPLQCLFCNVESASMDFNLTHMSHAHSFFIPDAEYLVDMESLLSYLFAVVSVFRECLFCGSSKTTKVGVQDHMRGKGHCKVDFEDGEHDLKEFYDFFGDVDDQGDEPETEVALAPIGDELRLPSGKVLGHRSRTRLFRQDLSDHPSSSSSSSSSRQQLLTEPDAETEAENGSETISMGSTDRRLAMRAGTSTSLIGVPELQRRALIAVEKQMEKMATREKNEYRHVLEKGGNRQKRYKVAGIGKKQGGLEKRLG